MADERVVDLVVRTELGGAAEAAAPAERRRQMETDRLIADMIGASPDHLRKLHAELGRLIDGGGLGGGAGASSWAPRDLSPVLADDYTPPQPAVLTRTDGRAYFYRGKKHSVWGDSEGGKSWFMLHAAAQEIGAERFVLFFDFEDTEGSVVPRLLALGVSPEDIRDRFLYVRPDNPLGPEDGVALATLASGCSLAIIDGVSEGMSLHGLNPDVGTLDTIKWLELLPRPLAEAGPAVVMIDHTAKGATPGARTQKGSGHKRAGIDVSYEITPTKPFGVGLHGEAVIRIDKDRPGQVRAYAPDPKREQGGTFHLKSSDAASALGWIDPPDPDASADGANPAASMGSFRPTALMERISRAIEGTPGMTKNAIETAIKGKTEGKRQALGVLVDEGHIVVERNGQALRHTVARPYRQSDDPDSDKYMPPVDGPQPTIVAYSPGEVVPVTGLPVPGPGPVCTVRWPDGRTELVPDAVTFRDAQGWARSVWADRSHAA